MRFCSEKRMMAIALRETGVDNFITPSCIVERGQPFLLVKGAEEEILKKCKN